MQASHKHWLAKFLVGTSALSLMGAAQTAMAQDAPADRPIRRHRSTVPFT